MLGPCMHTASPAPPAPNLTSAGYEHIQQTDEASRNHTTYLAQTDSLLTGDCRGR